MYDVRSKMYGVTVIYSSQNIVAGYFIHRIANLPTGRHPT